MDQHRAELILCIGAGAELVCAELGRGVGALIDFHDRVLGQAYRIHQWKHAFFAWPPFGIGTARRTAIKLNLAESEQCLTLALAAQGSDAPGCIQDAALAETLFLTSSFWKLAEK